MAGVVEVITVAPVGRGLFVRNIAHKILQPPLQPGASTLGKPSSFQGITLVPSLQVKTEDTWHSRVLNSLSFNRQDTSSRSENGPTPLTSLSHHLGPPGYS